MTKFESTNLLFRWFESNDSFCLSEDFNKVVLICENQDRDTAAVLLALDNLEKMEFISKQEVNEKVFWVLNKPFSQFPSTVEISPTLSKAIAENINQFCEIINDDTDLCDPTNITEKDIQNLVYMYTQTKGLLAKSSSDNNSLD